MTTSEKRGTDRARPSRTQSGIRREPSRRWPSHWPLRCSSDVPRAGVPHPLRLHGGHAARRRLPAGGQGHVRRQDSFHGHATARPCASRAAATSWCSGSAHRPRLHQALRRRRRPDAADRNDQLFIDGKPLEEPYKVLKHYPGPSSMTSGRRDRGQPPVHDGRQPQQQARTAATGTRSRPDRVVGRAFVLYWSVDPMRAPRFVQEMSETWVKGLLQLVLGQPRIRRVGTWLAHDWRPVYAKGRSPLGRRRGTRQPPPTARPAQTPPERPRPTVDE